MLIRLLYILIVLSVADPVQAASPYGRFYALVIGNQNYEHLRPLDTPIADAKAIAEVLERQYGFTVNLLLDADRDQFVEAIFSLRRTMRKQDNLLIYYAGHGELNKYENVCYWQPIDTDNNSDINGVPLFYINRRLRELQANHILVIADSCYSGILRRDSETKLPTTSREEWLRRMFERRSRIALTSDGLAPVQDSVSNGHSIFAAAFLEILRDNREILDSDRLFDRIKHAVAPLRTDQVPQYGVIRNAGQDSDQGIFLFVPKGLQGVELSGRANLKMCNTTSTRVTNKLLSREEQAQALYEWQHDIIYANDSQVVEDFLQRFPTGSHVLAAQRKLEELREYAKNTVRTYKPVVRSSVSTFGTYSPAHNIPQFPWPPPHPSAYSLIPSKLLPSLTNKNDLKNVAEKLETAFDQAGYSQRRYYQVPDGFVLVSQLEQFNPDGTPRTPPDRWASDFRPPKVFSLTSYLKALFAANPGRYRVIAFIVTSQPFEDSKETVTREEAMAWLDKGMIVLPKSIGEQPYTDQHYCTAYIYEFEQPGKGKKPFFRSLSNLTGKDHLEKSRLWAALER